MDIFDKATKKAKEIGNSVANTALNVGNTITNVTKEQGELASLKLQRSNLDKKLDASYAVIGRRYMEYVQNCDTEVTFDVSDVIERMQTELDKLAEINQQIADIEQQIRDNNAEKEKKKAQDQFDSEKKKLDKALELDIISQDEYEAKLAVAQKKFDNFEQLRKVEAQLEMDIITKAEYEEKVKNILEA